MTLKHKFPMGYNWLGLQEHGRIALNLTSDFANFYAFP